MKTENLELYAKKQKAVDYLEKHAYKCKVNDLQDLFKISRQMQQNEFVVEFALLQLDYKPIYINGVPCFNLKFRSEQVAFNRPASISIKTNNSKI